MSFATRVIRSRSAGERRSPTLLPSLGVTKDSLTLENDRTVTSIDNMSRTDDTCSILGILEIGYGTHGERVILPIIFCRSSKKSASPWIGLDVIFASGSHDFYDMEASETRRATDVSQLHVAES